MTVRNASKILVKIIIHSLLTILVWELINNLLKIASNEKYIDDHQTYESTWVSALCDFTNDFTKHYDEISKYFLEFSRLKELLKLATCQKRINRMKYNWKLNIDASQLPVELNDNANDYLNFVYVPAVSNLSSCFISVVFL
jgi:hypothetical protein